MGVNQTAVSVRRLAAGVLVGGAIAGGLAACGDDDSDDGATEETTASAEEVTLTATEYEFDLSATPAADTKTVEFVNDGKEFHVLVFAKINEGFTLDEAIELEGEKGSAETVGESQAEPGTTQTVKITQPLEAGSYAMLCPLQTKEGEPHYELGQLQEFQIE